MFIWELVKEFSKALFFYFFKINFLKDDVCSIIPPNSQYKLEMEKLFDECLDKLLQNGLKIESGYNEANIMKAQEVK